MRKVVFYVMYMAWDNAYGTYYGKELFKSDNYEECEQFCLSYRGDEETVFIQKAYFKEHS